MLTVSMGWGQGEGRQENTPSAFPAIFRAEWWKQKEGSCLHNFLSSVLLSRVAFDFSVLDWVEMNRVFVAFPKQSPFVCPDSSKPGHQCLFRLELIPEPGNQEEAV